MDRLRPLWRVAGAVEAAQVRRFGRSALSMAFRTPVLVLETTGRKTGLARRTTVAYERADGGDLLVAGGAGGQKRVPDWVANLRAEPVATATIDRSAVRVRARELAGEEREATWRELRQRWPRIDRYEERAGRPVPVFRLSADHSGFEPETS